MICAVKSVGIAMFLVSSSVFSCSKNIDDREAELVDHTNPKRVLSSVFFAAKEGRSGHLAALCDPLGGVNAHAQRICGQSTSGSDWPAFVRQFEKGKLIGEARISGDQAMVNFVFGEDGTDSETMVLVRRAGRWYLSSF